MHLFPKLCYIDCLLNLSDKTVKPSGSSSAKYVVSMVFLMKK